MAGEDSTSELDPHRSAILERRVARIRIFASCLIAVLMFAVSVAIVVLFHASDPLAEGFAAADVSVLMIATLSAVTFVAVGTLLFWRRADLVAARIAEAVLWVDLVVLGGAVIVLLSMGSPAVIVWIAALGCGIDLANQARHYRPPS
ncbi:hypothetical protein [Nocardia suismassiliense]|uniref:hypothetical protein n=1 Tax=Nocardia suismassiliense TaxID=2077092 RepID=UPI00131F0ADD|nr:hypothetical protein [Nocardia suismassiliense]